MNNSSITKITGTVYVAGDDIDTDQIIPAKYLNLVPTIPAEYDKLGSYALCGLPDSCQPFVKPGQMKTDYSIIVGGRNFGCGSSREHAPIALGAAGVKVIVAESYARIFFRNVVATGEFYPFECDQRLVDLFHTGAAAALDIIAGTLTNVDSGKIYKLKPLGAVAPVVAAGGIFAYARASGMIGEK